MLCSKCLEIYVCLDCVKQLNKNWFGKRQTSDVHISVNRRDNFFFFINYKITHKLKGKMGSGNRIMWRHLIQWWRWWLRCHERSVCRFFGTCRMWSILSTINSMRSICTFYFEIDDRTTKTELFSQKQFSFVWINEFEWLRGFSTRKFFKNYCIEKRRMDAIPVLEHHPWWFLRTANSSFLKYGSKCTQSYSSVLSVCQWRKKK